MLNIEAAHIISP